MKGTLWCGCRAEAIAVPYYVFRQKGEHPYGHLCWLLLVSEQRHCISSELSVTGHMYRTERCRSLA